MANKTKTETESRITIRIEYAGIIALVCLFGGMLIGSTIGTGKDMPSVPSTQSLPPGHEDMAKLIQEQTDPDVLIDIGNRAYDENRPDIAIPAYEKALIYRPNDPNVITDLGTMYKHNRQTSKAIEAFRKAASLDDKHIQSRFNLGVVLMETGDKEGARIAFQEVLDRNPPAEFITEVNKLLDKLGK